MGKKFTKRVENFTCEVCGTKVKGTGFTDHCPQCLVSKHVDVFPGDRSATCGGLMKPVGALRQKGKWQIFYRCEKCGLKRFNQASPDDNFQKIIALSSQPIKTLK